jgi:hypothetical protein
MVARESFRQIRRVVDACPTAAPQRTETFVDGSDLRRRLIENGTIRPASSSPAQLEFDLPTVRLDGAALVACAPIIAKEKERISKGLPPRYEPSRRAGPDANEGK